MKMVRYIPERRYMFLFTYQNKREKPRCEHRDFFKHTYSIPQEQEKIKRKLGENEMGNILCECAQCGQDIYKGYPFYKDNEDNYFCDKDCAVDFAIECRGIKETDYEGERPYYG